MKTISQHYNSKLYVILVLGFSLCISQPINASDRDNPIISGTVLLLPESTPYENVTLSFSGIGQVITNDEGYYEMEVPTGWNGIVTPSVCEGDFYEFSPPSILYQDVISDIADQDYGAETDTAFIISGTITEKETGDPLANMQVVFEKEFGGAPFTITVMTNDSGEYSFEQPPCWTNSVNPGVMDGFYYLEPFSREYTDLSEDVENQDYTFVNYEKPVPENWEYVQTGDAHIIAIENTSFPNLCGVPLELGDLIGVFYLDDEGELRCGGFGRWQDEKNVALIAQGDDGLTQVKEGFGYFEEMNWQTYSYSMEEEFIATPDYKTGGFLSSNNKFVPGGLSIVEEVDAVYENRIFIPAGWSGLSSYTKPNVQQLITKVMEPIINELVIIQDMTKMYYPAGGINNMFVWTFNKGYKIKVTEDTFLPMSGCQEANTTVNLETTWNLLPVLSICEVDPATLFEPVADKLIMIKDVAGSGVYWPELNINTLGNLQPGKAYFAAVSQNTSVTYDSCPEMKTMRRIQQDKIANESPWQTPEQTASAHIVAISADALNDFDEGDYIAACRNNGSCFGLARISDTRENQLLTLFGDDPMTENRDGFLEGEQIYLRAFLSASDEQVELEAVFSPDYANPDGKFVDHGISVIDGLKFSTSGIDEPASRVYFYPNPAKNLVTFDSSFGKNCQLIISNFQGGILLQTEISHAVQVDVSGFARGVYFVTISGENFTSIRKLVLN